MRRRENKFQNIDVNTTISIIILHVNITLNANSTPIKWK